MARIIGRNKEIKELHSLYKSDQAHLEDTPDICERKYRLSQE